MRARVLIALVLLGLVAASLADKPAFCSLPYVVGPCRASFRRFYFNPSAGRCENFFYGGCQGNDNNFQEITDCETTCGI